MPNMNRRQFNRLTAMSLGSSVLSLSAATNKAVAVISKPQEQGKDKPEIPLADWRAGYTLFGPKFGSAYEFQGIQFGRTFYNMRAFPIKNWKRDVDPAADPLDVKPRKKKASQEILKIRRAELVLMISTIDTRLAKVATLKTKAQQALKVKPYAVMSGRERLWVRVDELREHVALPIKRQWALIGPTYHRGKRTPNSVTRAFRLNEVAPMAAVAESRYIELRSVADPDWLYDWWGKMKLPDLDLFGEAGDLWPPNVKWNGKKSGDTHPGPHQLISRTEDWFYLNESGGEKNGLPVPDIDISTEEQTCRSLEGLKIRKEELDRMMQVLKKRLAEVDAQLPKK